jgi:hypothetical protein
MLVKSDRLLGVVRAEHYRPEHELSWSARPDALEKAVAGKHQHQREKKIRNPSERIKAGLAEQQPNQKAAKHHHEYQADLVDHPCAKSVPIAGQFAELRRSRLRQRTLGR